MTLEEMLKKLEEIRQALKSMDNDVATLPKIQWLGFANNELVTVIKTITHIKENHNNV